jgi:hypothetical protein
MNEVPWVVVVTQYLKLLLVQEDSEVDVDDEIEIQVVVVLVVAMYLRLHVPLCISMLNRCYSWYCDCDSNRILVDDAIMWMSKQWCHLVVRLQLICYSIGKLVFQQLFSKLKLIKTNHEGLLNAMTVVMVHTVVVFVYPVALVVCPVVAVVWEFVVVVEDVH